MVVPHRVVLAQRILSRIAYGLGPHVAGHPAVTKALLAAPRYIPEQRSRAFVFRQFSWPLSGFARTSFEVRTIDGLKMTVDTRDVIGRVLAVSGVWEPNISEVFRSRLSLGDICIDVGAHVGYYTLLACKLVGPAGHVYAFEPAPTAYRELRFNLAKNRASGVTALEIAAGDRDGTEHLYEGREANTGLSSLSPRSVHSGPIAARFVEEPVSVSVRPICSIVPAAELTRVRLVKIDVEGYEAPVLKGLRPLFALDFPLALLIELAGDAANGDARDELQILRDEHGFSVQKVANEYTAESYFPPKLVDPIDIDELPRGRCDLLLTRS